MGILRKAIAMGESADVEVRAWRSLPVHWYHLFVLIKYHKNFPFARWEIIQIQQIILVQNTDFRPTGEKRVDNARPNRVY